MGIGNDTHMADKCTHMTKMVHRGTKRAHVLNDTVWVRMRPYIAFTVALKRSMRRAHVRLLLCLFGVKMA